ncbi:hypothetical protein VTI28DRAFT_4800 [Corynascus sepedonium]
MDALEKLGRIGGVHWALYGARVDGVDSSALGELAGPGARHSFKSGLGAAVDRLRDEACSRRNRRKVDDAARPVLRQVRLCRLHHQQRAQDVDPVRRFEVVHRYLRKERVACDTRVVDDNVDLEPPAVGRRKVLLRARDERCGARRGTHIGLDGDGTDVVLLAEL